MKADGSADWAVPCLASLDCAIGAFICLRGQKRTGEEHDDSETLIAKGRTLAL
jgi:hypothetical protein